VGARSRVTLKSPRLKAGEDPAGEIPPTCPGAIEIDAHVFLITQLGCTGASWVIALP
jgi:hypothetical protein